MDLIADYFESLRFDVEINVVSSLSAFLKVLEDDPVYHLLRKEMAHPCNRQWLLARLKKLMEEDIDPQYAHPKDTAMTVYIHCILHHDPEYIHVLVPAFEAVPNIYYPRQRLRLALFGKVYV